jgi:hypothetical protein
MAQTKTKTKTKSKNSRKPKRSASASSKAAKAKTSKAKPKTAKSNGAAPTSNGAVSTVSKAKLPLLAGGVALAGTVGGVVLGATRSGGKVLGVRLPQSKRAKVRSSDLARAAKEVGRFGESVGDLTIELKKAREGLANGSGKHDSPIEILLKGLTHSR